VDCLLDINEKFPCANDIKSRLYKSKDCVENVFMVQDEKGAERTWRIDCEKQSCQTGKQGDRAVVVGHLRGCLLVNATGAQL